MEQFVSTFSASGRPAKETCRQCRFRKVRCDGKHNEKGCGDCERLKFDCSFVTTAGPQNVPAIQTTTSTYADSRSAANAPPPNPTTVEAGRVVERRRTSKACAYCRQQKVRCSGGTPCLACKKRGASCIYGTDRRRGSRVAPSSVAGTPTEATFAGQLVDEASGADDTSATSPTSPETTSSEPVTVTLPRPRVQLLPPDMQVLVEFYFRHVYPLPSYAFLHPSTTIRQCSEGSLDTCLAYAVSAVASHHRGPAHNRDDAELGWIQATEDLIWKNLESPTLTRLQALLLVVLYRVETGGFQRAFMLSSLAARAAAALRLNYERTAPHDSPGRVAQEDRRRLMWSLKLVERYFCMGLPEFELCPVDSIYLDLPCSEEHFSGPGDLDDGAERDFCLSDHGTYRLCVRVEMLRRDVVKLTRSLSVYDAPFPRLASLMRDFEQHLEAVGADLPGGLTLTVERISQLAGTPWLSRQILVYLSFHQCHCDLYRILLRGYREAAPAVILNAMDQALLERAEQLCLQHATAIVDILATLNQQSQRAQLLEFDTAICGYHAVRLLLFTAQFSRLPSRPSEEWALSRAELCIASLRRFFPTSKLVRPVLEEMRRIIAVFSARSAATTPSRLASPGPTINGAKDHAAGLSAAARVRQRLAIHSLLRQAEFTDEEDAGEERRGSDANRWTASPRAISPSNSHGPPGSTNDGPSSDQTPFDNDLWQFRWPSNGALDGWDADLHRGGPPKTPPFSFPWLQRREGLSTLGGEMA